MKRNSDDIADFEKFRRRCRFLPLQGHHGRWREVLTVEELDQFDRRANSCPSKRSAWTIAGQAALSD